jgi:hypothetical protein
MMTDTTYNGWTNYETWLANLWLDNDGYAVEEISNVCLGMMGSWEDKSDVDWRLGDHIKDIMQEWVNLNQEHGQNGFVTDLISAAFQQINFREIAGHFYDELKDLEEQD